MRKHLFPALLALALPAHAVDLAEGFTPLGQVEASVGGESFDLVSYEDKRGNPTAFFVKAGGPVSLTVDAMVVGDKGMPVTPRVIVSLIMMGPAQIVESVQFHEPGSTSSSEIWMMQGGMGEASFTDATLSDDGVFTGTLNATLHRAQINGTAVDGHDPITLTATIDSQLRDITP